jgi:hypothetical protein
MQQEDLVSTAIVFHQRLNPKLWSKGKLKPQVRFHLLEIANHFVDYIEIDNLGLRDITISGSNAGYTYSRKSDIDLHLIVDIPQDKKQILKQLFDAKKNQYNFQHDITIRNIDVELYVQDAEQTHTSVGIYSVLDNKWLKVPDAVEDKVDRAQVKVKYKQYVGKVRTALRSDNLEAVQKTSDDIRNLRQQGLDKEGELGVENITFKVLRAKGYLEQLRNHISKLKAEKLSLENNNEN